MEAITLEQVIEEGKDIRKTISIFGPFYGYNINRKTIQGNKRDCKNRI